MMKFIILKRAMVIFKLVTYPSPDDVAGRPCDVSCCASGIAASPKSKYWPISETLGVAMVPVCHPKGAFGPKIDRRLVSSRNDERAFRQSVVK